MRAVPWTGPTPARSAGAALTQLRGLLNALPARQASTARDLAETLASCAVLAKLPKQSGRARALLASSVPKGRTPPQKVRKAALIVPKGTIRLKDHPFVRNALLGFILDFSKDPAILARKAPSALRVPVPAQTATPDTLRLREPLPALRVQPASFRMSATPHATTAPKANIAMLVLARARNVPKASTRSRRNRHVICVRRHES